MSGAEVSLASLLRNLDPERYLPVVLLPGEGPLYDELKDDFHVRFVPMRRFKKARNPLLLLLYFINVCRAIWQISFILRKENIKLIHSNSTNAHIFGGIAGWINGVPSVWHVRDTVPLGILGKILFALSARVIVTSRFVKEAVSNYAENTGQDKILMVYNGVDLSVFSHIIEQKTKIPGIAMIGQLVPWKRHDDFIRTAKKVLAEIPDAKFFIVGDDLFDDHPAYKAELKKMAGSLGTEKSVIFMGYCRNIPQFLNGIDVLVHPARVEPFGRVIVEAMAMKKPVVAVRNGGPSEIIEDGKTGYLVRPGDIENMAGAVIDLIRNPNMRKEMGKRGRKKVEESFGIIKHAYEIMEIYCEYCC